MLPEKSRLRGRAWILLPLLLALGCASGKKETIRYFWPLPPDQPRIEYVGTYASENDLSNGRGREWMEKVVGKDNPQMFKKPLGIKSDGEGKVYVTDPNQASVFVYDFVSRNVLTLGESGLYITPVGIAVDGGGNVYVSDSAKNMVFVFSKDGKPLSSFGKGNLFGPSGVAVGDKIYVVNTQGHNISVFDLNGEFLFTIGERGEGAGKFNFPVGAVINSRGELIVADSMNALVQIFASDGKFLRQFGCRGDDSMCFAIIKGVAVDSDDHIYVTDSKSNKLMIFTSDGDPLLSFNGRFYDPKKKKVPLHSSFTLPAGIDIDNNNFIYVVDSWNRRFHVYRYMDEEYLKYNPEKPSILRAAAKKP